MLPAARETEFALDRDDNIDHLQRQLRDKVSPYWSNFHALPTYHIATSLGENLTITTFRLSPKDTYSSSDVLCMIAQNKEGEIVGYQRRYIYDFGASVEVTGYIYAGIRKTGIAVPLELAQKHALQTIADETGKEVLRKVTNGNEEVLKRFQCAIGSHPTQEDREELERKYEEQKGWQHVYGERGILGISWKDQRDEEPTGLQVLLPYPNKHHAPSRAIYLRREDIDIPIGYGLTERRANPVEVQRVLLRPEETEQFRLEQIAKVQELLGL